MSMIKFLRGVANDLVNALVLQLKRNETTDTGRLINSISTKVIFKAGKPVIRIRMVEYGKDIEFGTTPHTVNPEDLKGWAKRKLGKEGLAYPVAKKIKKYGTRPQPFIRPVIHQELPKIIKQNTRNL
jgi:hypothetical protein